MKMLSIILFTALVSTQTWADDLAKPNCKQPVIPIPNASEVVVKYFKKHGVEYEKCIDKFVKEQQEIAKTDTVVAKANAAHDAAESAIAEYNKFMEEVNERNRQAGIAPE